MSALEPEAKYVAIDAIDYEPAAGASGALCKRLLNSECLDIWQQRLTRGSGAHDYEAELRVRLVYVLSGRGELRQPGETRMLSQGHLVVIPAGPRQGARLSALSDELVVLNIARGSAGARTRGAGASADATDARPEPLRVVRPEDVTPYEPAGHARTTNRCLFIDDDLEVIEGFIDAGGGADRHFHEHNEQAIYVLEVPAPLLIHYPRGAPHGTGGGIADAMKLLVVYAPPLGESRDALR